MRVEAPNIFTVLVAPVVMNESTSHLFAVVVSVGAEPPVQRTTAGHEVMVRDPVPS